MKETKKKASVEINVKRNSIKTKLLCVDVKPAQYSCFTQCTVGKIMFVYITSLDK